MYIILSKTLEEIELQSNHFFGVFILILAFIILASIALDRLLRKVFALKRRKDIHGYIKHKYVNRFHQIGGILIQTVMAILTVYLSVQDYLSVRVLDLMVGLIFVALIFEAFMLWKYPVQKNEYKKVMCELLLFTVIVPYLYQLTVDYIAR